MKKIIAALLLLLSAYEMILPVVAAAHRKDAEPRFAAVFDAPETTDRQRQLGREFQVAVASDWDSVFYCGMVTLVASILFLAGKTESSTPASDEAVHPVSAFSARNLGFIWIVQNLVAGLLLLLGAYETLLLPAMAGARAKSFHPRFVKAFNLANATEEQRQLFKQSTSFGTGYDWTAVFWCGIATMILGFLFLVANSKKSGTPRQSS